MSEPGPAHQIPTDYEYDEEALGFPEPASRGDGTSLSLAQRVAYFAVAAGLVAGVIQASGGLLTGTWAGLALSFGQITVGTAVACWLEYRDTSPGIKHDGIWFHTLFARGAAGWIMGILMTALFILIYWFPAAVGERTPPEPNVGLVRLVDPLHEALVGGQANRWFFYGVLYTLAILVFAVRAWMKYRHSRHQKIRTLSVCFFQLALAFLIPNWLVRFQQPYMELNGVWPLKHHYLWPDKVTELTDAGTMGMFLLAWSIVLVLVATPVLTYYFGKRWYCSWVCGCGGLAETLGDPWRHLSSNSTGAWRVERWTIHSVLVLVLVATIMLWGEDVLGWSLYGYADTFRQAYGFAIGAVFSGVVGVGFYPLLGNRVWCRFGCPQAAILGIFQRYFSRFRITTNGGQCMSCGNCSTYCEMGIDVQAYAHAGENIVRASCVGCGVCSEVCPRGVLRLENGDTHTDRYQGAGTAWKSMLEDLRTQPRQPESQHWQTGKTSPAGSSDVIA